MSASGKKRPALGRGLGALIPPAKKTPPPEPREPEPTPRTTDPPPAASAPIPAPAAASAPPAAEPRPEAAIRTVPIEVISPNRDQPRKHFDRAQLEELARSIRNQGIIQPIVVSPRTGIRGEYLIVAGERRWRAAQIAGLHDVPVVVRDANEFERLELALVENIQRADLNPMEEAQAFKQLMRLRDYTQDELAERVGKDRSTISNTLRLLRLPDRVRELVQEGKLSMGHARALLGLASEIAMEELAREIVRSRLSVRATEAAVRKRLSEREEDSEDDETRRRRIIVKELEDRLRRKLGVRVRLKSGRGKKGAGTLELPYSDLDELDRLLRVILDGEGG